MSQPFATLCHATWALIGEINEESVFNIYRNISRTANKNHILLLLASPGGDVGLTSCLIQAITQKYPVFETRAIGEVASAAVHLMLAGSLRTAFEPATFFTHSMSGETEITPHSAKKYAQVLKYQDDWIANLFAERTKKKDPAFWVDFFSKDRFFTSREAKRLGIIHEIL